MILYVKNSKELKEALKLINEFNKFKGHRSIYKNHSYFLYSSKGQNENDIK